MDTTITLSADEADRWVDEHVQTDASVVEMSTDSSTGDVTITFRDLPE